MPKPFAESKIILFKEAEEVNSRDYRQDFTSKVGLLGELQLQKKWENNFSSAYYLYWKFVTHRNLANTI